MYLLECTCATANFWIRLPVYLRSPVDWIAPTNSDTQTTIIMRTTWAWRSSALSGYGAGKRKNVSRSRQRTLRVYGPWESCANGMCYQVIDLSLPILTSPVFSAVSGDVDKELSRPSSGLSPGMGRITGSASIETLVRVGIEKEHGLSPDSKMVVLHDFVPCVDDELEVRDDNNIVNVVHLHAIFFLQNFSC